MIVTTRVRAKEAGQRENSEIIQFLESLIVIGLFTDSAQVLDAHNQVFSLKLHGIWSETGKSLFEQKMQAHQFVIEDIDVQTR